ncbi:MAG: glycosyltransferase family 2 protein [Lachnospiraceae bacterium]
MENIKVSVIVPIYNAESYLRKSMNCILSQTLKEIEIICVDDGSTDQSGEILKDFAKADARIQIITQKNAGAGAARNAGLKRAKGEYLSFLDADDFFEPDMLKTAYEKAKEKKAQIIVFGSDQYREDLQNFQPVSWTIRKHALPPYRPMNHRTFTDNVFKVFVGWAWDKLFEREFVLKYGLTFQEQRTSNDLLFVFTAIVLAENIEVEDRVLIHQRRDNPNSLSNTREKSWHCFYDALIALRENLKKFGLYQELEQDFINYSLHFSLWNLNTLQGEKKKILYHKLKKEWFRELGITEHPESYYYDKKEYMKYRKIMKSTWRAYEKNERI